MTSMAALPIPADIRTLLDAPNVVHLSTLRTDGSPRNWVVWVGLEGERVLICTGDTDGNRPTCAVLGAWRCP